MALTPTWAQGGLATQLLSPETTPELKAKAAAGDPRAQVALAHAYQEGNGVSQSDSSAAKWYRAAAEQGDAEAQNRLGVMYRYGEGVERDKEEAVKWYKAAAQQGYGPALFNLGAAYYNGEGVRADQVAAYMWFLLAEEAGSVEARAAVERSRTELSDGLQLEAYRRLAEMFEDDGELPADAKSSVAWYRKAAAEGDAASQLRVCAAYALGRGVERDENEARRWREMALRQQYSPAMYLTGRLHETGAGVEKDLKAAMEWYEKAALRGHGQAAERLGLLYLSGEGVPHDRFKAYVWLRWAAALRVENPELQRLESEFDKKQRAKADKEVNKIYEKARRTH